MLQGRRMFLQPLVRPRCETSTSSVTHVTQEKSQVILFLQRVKSQVVEKSTMKSQLRKSEAAVFRYYVNIFQKSKSKICSYSYIYLQYILFIIGIVSIFRSESVFKKTLVADKMK